MKTVIKLAWRNIWRNRKRALITMASVFFAVFFCVIMDSFNVGTWERMMYNNLKTQSGHIQIHDKDYWDDQIIDNFMYMDEFTIAQLSTISNIENVSPRVETFAMASFGLISKGIAVIGVSPEKEAQKSNLSSRIVQGEYLSEIDDGILIGERLSKYLKISVGDTMALIGQGYRGSNAAQLFPIRGILNFMMPEMDYGMAYITLPAAQQFIDMPDGYSGILISIKDNNKLDEIIQNIEQIVDTQTLDVYSWHFTMEKLLQSAQLDRAFSLVLMFILYVIVGFGILGTVIMMTNERKREFSMMISLGMSRMKLTAVIVVELLLMTLIGLTLALAVTLLVTHWFAAYPIALSGDYAEMFTQFGMEPILPMSVETFIYTNQMLTILIISLFAAIYPVRKILKLKITNKN